MKYIALGNLVVDDLYFLDGNVKKGIAGGVGYYMATAIRALTEEVMLFSEAGSDFDELFLPHFEKTKMRTDGIYISSDKKSYANELHYNPDGRWNVKLKYERINMAAGTNEMKIDYGLLAEEVADCKGMVISISLSSKSWDIIRRLHKMVGFKLCYEPYPRDLIPEFRFELKKRIQQVDIFSINYPETKDVFEVKNKAEAISLYKKMSAHTDILFRCGKEGAYLISKGEVYHGPLYKAGRDIDPTGCGNCSTAATTFGLCEGYGEEKAVKLGSVVAGINAVKFGAMDKFSAKQRNDILRTVGIK